MAPKEIEETLRKDRTGMGDKGKGWRSENDDREIKEEGNVWERKRRCRRCRPVRTDRIMKLSPHQICSSICSRKRVNWYS